MCQYWMRSLSVCLHTVPNIYFRDKNLQSHLTHGNTGSNRLATCSHAMHYCLFDASSAAGFVHNLCGGECFSIILFSG